MSRTKSDDKPLRNETKGGKPRTVPLVPSVWKIVEPLTRDRNPEELLF